MRSLLVQARPAPPIHRSTETFMPLDGPLPAADSIAAPVAAAPADTAAGCLPAGYRLREFVIERVIAEGGFGVVYAARDARLQRRVAIKEYMPALLARRAGDFSVQPRSSVRHQDAFAVGLRSFINEAQLLARFDHPALVRVLQFWEDKGTGFIVMPLYEGPTLRHWLERHPRPSEAWLRGFLDAALDALAALHAQACLHRDIAPDNMLVLQDRAPLLLDFGAARRLVDELAQTLTVIVKPGFAPLEQYADCAAGRGGRELRQGPWTDLYALCATAHAVVTGRAPLPAVARVVADDMPPLVDAGNGRYSRALLAALDAGLALRPEQRPQSVDAMRALLARSEDDEDQRTVLLLPAGVALEAPAAAATAGLPAGTVEPRGATQSPAGATACAVIEATAVGPTPAAAAQNGTGMAAARAAVGTTGALAAAPAEAAFAPGAAAAGHTRGGAPTGIAAVPAAPEHPLFNGATAAPAPAAPAPPAALAAPAATVAPVAMLAPAATAATASPLPARFTRSRWFELLFHTPVPTRHSASIIAAALAGSVLLVLTVPAGDRAAAAPAGAAQRAPQPVTLVQVQPVVLLPPAPEAAAARGSTAAAPDAQGSVTADAFADDASPLGAGADASRPLTAGAATAASSARSQSATQARAGGAAAPPPAASAARPAAGASKPTASPATPASPAAATQSSASPATAPISAAATKPSRPLAAAPAAAAKPVAAAVAPASAVLPAPAHTILSAPGAAAAKPATSVDLAPLQTAAKPAASSSPASAVAAKPVASPSASAAAAAAAAQPQAAAGGQPPVALVAAPDSAAAAAAELPRASLPLQPLERPQPEFPAELRRDGITAGRVVARLAVEPDGRVGAVRILSAVPQRAFGRAVERATLRWRYQAPGERREVDVEFVFRVE